jgi:hypothetical protein
MLKMWFPALVAGCLCISQALAAEASTDSADVVIAEWSGSGAGSTRPFHPEGPWEFQWSSPSGGIFGAWLYDVNHTGPEASDYLSILAMTGGNGKQRPEKGSSYQPKGGDYYVSFVASGDWTARVVAVHESAKRP